MIRFVMRAHTFVHSTLSCAVFLTLSLACAPESRVDAAQVRTLRLPVRSDGPRTLDPAGGVSNYDHRAVVMLYQPLLQYSYLEEPLRLEPLLLESLPQVSADGTSLVCTLKEGVRFHDDPCFPGGAGRRLVATDVAYSWKRLADPSVSPVGAELFAHTLVGFDDYRERQSRAVEAGGTFDYDEEIEGLRVLDDRRFEIELTRPVYRFLYVLARFQTAIVPREAVEAYGEGFARHPVGTGPFRMAEEDWVPKQRITFTRNPDYHGERFPVRGPAFAASQGKALPLVDRVVMTFFAGEQAMWLDFLAGKLAFTEVPNAYHDQAFEPQGKKLREELVAEGISARSVPMYDFVFRGFNMEDELVGGYDERGRSLRQAISLAVDFEEFNRTFYHGDAFVYDGMIPPGLDGHPEGGVGRVNFRGPDLPRARELLARAGYPGGAGLGEIPYYLSSGGNGQEQAELMARQLAEVGIRIRPRFLPMGDLLAAIARKEAPFFSFAWVSDWPDAENNLGLFYGPNAVPGPNRCNYRNGEYDALYRSILTMPPSTERTAIYDRMREMVMADVPFVGSMARKRSYLAQPWLENFEPTEAFYNWIKYLDVRGES